MLLCYLPQYRNADVRDKIHHFTNKGNEEYALALIRLEIEYGRPCIIAYAVKRQLKTAEADPEGSRRF